MGFFSLANRGLAAAKFAIFQGFRASIANMLNILLMFQGGGGSGPLSPSRSVHALAFRLNALSSQPSAVVSHLSKSWAFSISLIKVAITSVGMRFSFAAVSGGGGATTTHLYFGP